MGTTESKFKPTKFSCYEVCHTWTPSCTGSAVDVGMACVLQSVQIYSTIYLGGAVLKGKIPTTRELLKLLISILRSSCFLSYNAFGFVAAHCGVRMLLGHYNFLSLSLIPGWLSSFAAILVEKPSRRSMLATYVTNVASESVYNSLLLHKIIPPIKYLDFVLFTVSITGYFHLCQPQQDTHLNDPILKLSRFILNGKGSKERPSDEKEFSVILQDTMKHFMFAFMGESALSFIKFIRSGKSLQNKTFLGRHGFSLFVASVTFSSRVTNLFLKKVCGGESKDWHAAISGLLSSPSFLLFRSRTAAFYLFWKLVEIYTRKLNSEGVLPTVPFFTEMLYATSTGLLFYFGMLEPHSLRKSYLDFLNRITGDKILQVNHGLIDDLYGSKTALVHDFKPVYQEKYISQALRSRLPKNGSLV